MSSTAQSLAQSTVTGAPSLDSAYRTCRAIARKQAKNFYYAFRALPASKRNAICAVYAFMRHADDLSDDETQTRSARREQLTAWLETWHSAAQGGLTTDPVFIALADARSRYEIPLELLDKLVYGTAMDLEQGEGSSALSTAPPNTYATFNDLYRYCYLVASVVGLVCIRIFGYTGPLAEQLAEELGIAFQLTNILRDVREDADRSRIYLPLEDLATYAISPSTLYAAARGIQSQDTERALRHLLGFEAARAERFYTSGRLLLPMITPDSRAALWVLMTIYHRLLGRIIRADYDVFSTRLSVPTHEKLTILGLGIIRIAGGRIFGR